MNTNPLLSTIAALLIAFGTTSAQAVIIGFDPASVVAEPSDLISVDLVAMLNDNEPAVGAYDVDVVFDPDALTVVSVSTGGDLGLSLFDTLRPSATTIDISEVSLEDLATLEALQDNTVVLAVLQFTVDMLEEDTSTRVFLAEPDPSLFVTDDPGSLDAFNEIVLQDLEISNPGDVQPVSEPPLLSLMLGALLLVSVSARSRRPKGGTGIPLGHADGRKSWSQRGKASRNMSPYLAS